jgi:hypothetical protein
MTEAFARSVHDDGEPEPAPLRAVRPQSARPTDRDADRLAAEVDAEDEAEDDGSIVVTLETDRGGADIRVPPVGRWRSQARAALFSRGDDFTWAALTLSVADAQTWARLDPTKDDSDEFFARWGEETGQNLASSQPSNRASRRTRRR